MNYKDKLKQGSQMLLESVEAIKKEEQMKKEYSDQIKRLTQQVVLNPEEYHQKVSEGINSTMPSKEYIEKVFSKKEEYFKRHLEIEKNFYLQSNFNEKINTRFGSNPPHQNTFRNIQAPENAGMYISEKERFDAKDMNSYVSCMKDKENQIQIYNSKIRTLKNINSTMTSLNNRKDYNIEERKIYSLYQRTQRLYKYENVFS